LSFVGGVPLLFFGSIEDSDGPLAAGMDVDMPDFDRPLVTSPMPVKRLDHIEMEPQKLGGKTAVNGDVGLIHVMLALTQEFKPRKAGRHNLNGKQGLKLGLRFFSDEIKAIAALRVASSNLSVPRQNQRDKLS
jgi:hypothetical protein